MIILCIFVHYTYSSVTQLFISVLRAAYDFNSPSNVNLKRLVGPVSELDLEPPDSSHGSVDQKQYRKVHAGSYQVQNHFPVLKK